MGRAVSRLSVGILILFACCQPLSAVNEDNSEGNTTSSSSAPSLADELREMRELIHNQSQQIKQLQLIVEQQQRELGKIISKIPPTAGDSVSGAVTAHEARLDSVRGNGVDAVAESAAQTDQRLTKVEANAAATKKSLEARSKQLGNFNFSGDVRIRYEPFIQEDAVTRHRERFRARFNMTGQLSDEFSGGISLATGTLDDPVSTNQTMTSFFNRKNFGLDRAYITYRPGYAKFLKLDAGKFAFPWYRTPLTFDSDLNPEGFAETFSFDFSSPLQSVTVVGFQLPFNELSGGHDSFALGGQLQAHYRIGPKVRLSLYGAGINIHRADPIAVALGIDALKPSLPNSNSLKLNSNGVVIGYAGKFAYLDAIVKLDMSTHPRFPTMLLFDFVNNVRGSHERSGYWAEASVGRGKEAGDIQFGYTFIRIEKDAVIGAWNESDMRSSTNVLNHRLAFSYLFKGNVAGQFTAWIGRLANPLDNINLVPAGMRDRCRGPDVSSCEDPYLKRLQFDVIYKF